MEEILKEIIIGIVALLFGLWVGTFLAGSIIQSDCDTLGTVRFHDTAYICVIKEE